MFIVGFSHLAGACDYLFNDTKTHGCVLSDGFIGSKAFTVL
jgi:hypothetical protein